MKDIQGIFNALSAMSNLTIVEDPNKNEAFISKDGKKFIMMKGEDIYLINNEKEFEKIDLNLLSGPDGFLELATKSFWVASDRFNMKSDDEEGESE